MSGRRLRTSGRKGRPDGHFHPKTSFMTSLVPIPSQLQGHRAEAHNPIGQGPSLEAQTPEAQALAAKSRGLRCISFFCFFLFFYFFIFLFYFLFFYFFINWKEGYWMKV
jgi:hypothetical protein